MAFHGIVCCSPAARLCTCGGCANTQPCAILHLSLSCSPAGSKKYIILDGQHKYSAARIIRERALEQGLEPPVWTGRFRCKKLFMRTTKDVRERIAGREQARTKTVKQQAVSDMCVAIERELRQLKNEAARLEQPVVLVKSQVLRDVYMKCGCTPKMDGTMVCP